MKTGIARGDRLHVGELARRAIDVRGRDRARRAAFVHGEDDVIVVVRVIDRGAKDRARDPRLRNDGLVETPFLIDEERVDWPAPS